MLNYKEDYLYEIEDDQTEQQIKQKIRLGFIRKVYGIILLQVLITTIAIYVAMISEGLRTFIQTNPAFIYLCIAGVLFTEIPVLCCKSIAQTVPLNYILLFIFTLCESYILASTTISFEPLSVLFCAGITLAIIFGLTIYACFTKTDLTMCGGALVSFSVIFLVLSIIGIFYDSLFYQALINSCGIFLFSLYLIYDTQLVIGNNKNFISSDDYIVGAMMIYIDIVSLFIKILLLLGKKKK